MKKSTRPPFEWLNEESRLFLQRGYLKEGVEAVERIREIADTAEQYLGIKGYSDKFFEYMSRGWFSLSSPIWSNYGLKRGSPISCFGGVVDDSIQDIMTSVAEIGMMSKIGGGTSSYLGKIRPRGSEITDNGKSDGSFNFLKLFDTVIDVISQGKSRKGQFAGYIDIDHADIDEWLDIQSEGNPIQLMYYGVCITTQWIEEMKAGDRRKREVWAKVLEARKARGIPYLFFTDNVNNNTVDVYKDKNLPIYASNLCTEIALPASVDESFVCCLSSMNLLHWDEWKDTDAPEVLTFFLDTVITEFCNKNRDVVYMDKAVRFAERHRALGLGVLGYHSMLQRKLIPFDSFEASMLNREIFRTLQKQTLEASKKLAKMFGEPEILKGYGRRNTTLMTIAPTKSSSFILGSVSQGIEPITSNYFVKDLAKIKSTYINPMLKELLASKGLDKEEIWESILLNDGSVQHLKEELTDLERDVYKTFGEISQLAIIQQAAQRQKYIDQSQSLNLLIHPNTPTKELNQLYMTAIDLGIKTFYYQKSLNAAQIFNRDLLSCSNCEA